ncbi:hypothetical protein M7I_6567 [Glarea lozoyensis 74030]|uniref:Uncharacterized protein n=1 Tax=Glarea lozoyensis (strain ATCC 74030 / MF5533) TaxID=1104152 RepID=H0EUX7_GLAL7|nr:hypothetical protein M7I_6567 [Glarea lozoyensis 74030]
MWKAKPTSFCNMRHSFAALLGLAAIIVDTASACGGCNNPLEAVVHERNVRRMQPEASGAVSGPKAELEWGQLNFMHTTDTHGWLEGHLKEQNYGADWGDFVSFSRHMVQKAGNLGVDLLLVDTGDLHDGNGLSDAALPNGVLSNPIFDEIQYDALTIGNHELYISDIAYETFANFSKVWGEKYITSNVQIVNPATGQLEYIGKKYRYFTTPHGLRIMTFGVLFDFTGNSNVSKVIKAADMIKQDWFLAAVNYPQPIDLFLIIGHNPVRTTDSSSTIGLLQKTIRAMRPEVPIQAFGGHSHIRDFQVYDDKSTGLESATNTSTSGLVYSRRYLDWNRLTFEYHATKSQESTFDYHSGLRVTGDITNVRKKLNLTSLYGCAPATYCASCLPFGAPGNINSLISTALGEIVVNPSRATTPRYVIVNTGSIRFDLVKGPFTYDDSFIVSPFNDAFQYIKDVPYDMARKVLASINGAPLPDKRDLFDTTPRLADRTCADPIMSQISGVTKREPIIQPITRRQTIVTPGYVTKDDFGTDGDDTVHSKIPSYAQPNYVQGNGSFPTTGTPATVDVVFLDYFATTVVKVLNAMGGSYTYANDVSYYLDPSYTTQNYLPDYAKKYWQANVPNCPVGQGVGYPDK